MPPRRLSHGKATDTNATNATITTTTTTTPNQSQQSTQDEQQLTAPTAFAPPQNMTMDQLRHQVFTQQLQQQQQIAAQEQQHQQVHQTRQQQQAQQQAQLLVQQEQQQAQQQPQPLAPPVTNSSRTGPQPLQPGPRSTGRNVILTNEYRKQICQKRLSNPELTLEELGIWAQEAFNLARKPAMGTLSRILGKQDRYNHMTESELRSQRKRDVLCSDLEDALIAWVHECQERNLHVSYKMIIEKARSLAEFIKSVPGREQSEMPNFSNGWVSGFTKRHNFVGTSLNAPGAVSLASLMEESSKLLDILGHNGENGAGNEGDSNNSNNAGAGTSTDAIGNNGSNSSSHGASPTNASSSNSSGHQKAKSIHVIPSNTFPLPAGMQQFSSNAELVARGMAVRIQRESREMMMMDHEMEDGSQPHYHHHPHDHNMDVEMAMAGSDAAAVAIAAAAKAHSQTTLDRHVVRSPTVSLTSKGAPRKVRGRRSKLAPGATRLSSPNASTRPAATVAAEEDATMNNNDNNNSSTANGSPMQHPAAPGILAERGRYSPSTSSVLSSIAAVHQQRQHADLLQQAILQSAATATSTTASGSSANGSSSVTSSSSPTSADVAAAGSTSTTGVLPPGTTTTGRPTPTTAQSLAAVRVVIDSVNTNIPAEVELYRPLFEMARRLQDEIHAQERQSTDLMSWVK